MVPVTALGRILLGAGIAGLGILGMVYGGLVPNRQPLPDNLVVGETIALVSNLVLVGCGIGLFWDRIARISALTLALFLLSWLVLLHFPLISAKPSDFLKWAYANGVVMVAAGAVTLWAMLACASENPHRDRLGHLRTLLGSRVAIGLTLIVFSIPHLYYTEGMSTLVPAGLPQPKAIVLLTGGAHLAAGLALLFGILPRLAATLEASMMSIFVLAIDVPHVAQALARRQSWTALCFETAMVGAVWLVAGSLSDRPYLPRAPKLLGRVLGGV